MWFILSPLWFPPHGQVSELDDRIETLEAQKESLEKELHDRIDTLEAQKESLEKEFDGRIKTLEAQNVAGKAVRLSLERELLSLQALLLTMKPRSVRPVHPVYKRAKRERSPSIASACTTPSGPSAAVRFEACRMFIRARAREFREAGLLPPK